MKIALMAVLGVTAPVYAYQPADLYGTWQCTTAYPSIDAEARDHIVFSRGGKVSVKGEIDFRFNGHTFRYRRPSDGRWQFDGNKLLVLTLDTGKTEASHSQSVRQAIDTDPIMAAHNRMVYRILSEDRTNQQIFLYIEQLDKRTMRQTQLESTNGKEMAETHCRRL